MELAITAKFQSLLGVTYKPDGSYSIKYKSLYYWFMLWTMFGAEYGYLVLLPTWQWNFDAHVLRHTLIITVATMYFGQLIKCYTPWPRPSSPPVVRLEHITAAESTMPSTHACLGTVLPFSLLFFSLQLYDVSPAFCIFLASFCTINVCLSRLYLGMHYPSDLVAGCIISFFMIIFLYPYVLRIDAFFLEYPYLAILGIVFLAAIFPATSTNENNLRADTCRILAVLLASCIANKFFYELGLAQIPCPSPNERMPFPPENVSFKLIGCCFLRFAIGFPLALLVREGCSVVFHPILLNLINLFPPSCTPPKGIPIKRWGPYEVPFYLTTYTLVALTAMFATTYLFLITGITSPGYLSQYPNIMKVPHDNPLNFYCVPAVTA